MLLPVVLLSVLASPFGGSSTATSGGGGSTGCGVDQTCVAPDFEATTATGPGFECNSQTTSCMKAGPGACNVIGTNPAGDLVIGSGCTSALQLRIGTATSLNGSGTLEITNGAFVMNNATFLTDPFNTVDVIDPEGLRINNGAPLIRVLREEISIDVPTITNMGTYTATATVTGAQAGDSPEVDPGPSCSMPDGFRIAYAQVTGPNTVRYSFGNGNSASSINPDPCTFIFRVTR